MQHGSINARTIPFDCRRSEQVFCRDLDQLKVQQGLARQKCKKVANKLFAEARYLWRSQLHWDTFVSPFYAYDPQGYRTVKYILGGGESDQLAPCQRSKGY